MGWIIFFYIILAYAGAAAVHNYTDKPFNLAFAALIALGVTGYFLFKQRKETER